MLSDIDVLNTLKFMNQNSKLIKLKLDQGNLALYVDHIDF